jgi:hypothetical protein
MFGVAIGNVMGDLNNKGTKGTGIRQKYTPEKLKFGKQQKPEGDS